MRVLSSLRDWMRVRFCGTASSSREETVEGEIVTSSTPLKKGALDGWPDAKMMDARAIKQELDVLPNDLARLVYLASLRDCNSGVYRHPQLSRRIGTARADDVLRSCHEEIFRSILRDPLSDQVLQLETYISYTRVDKMAVIGTWKSLEAYRTAVPLAAHKVYSQLFSLNTAVALRILEKKIKSAGSESSQSLKTG